MPMPMMPQVPTSMRFLGLYMSTIERVKSSALAPSRSEEHTSELQSLAYLVCRLLLEKSADHRDLHSFPTRRSSDLGEAEGAVALDRDHRLLGRDRRGDAVAHADAHDAPGADVDALPRLVHVDDRAREVERVGAFEIGRAHV